MKKVKMLFVGVSVLAVVGGALAFKAKNAGVTGTVYCTTSSNPVCTADTRIQFVIAGSSTANPCAAGSPYIINAGSCVASSGPFQAADPR